MNINQAREQFSAYFGDTLDSAMRQAFERARQSDPEIDREYREFESTLALLPGLLEEKIEIPADLHERISARIDRHVWDKSQKRSLTLFGNWRYSFAGGLAVLAVVGTFLAIKQPSGAGSATAGLGLSGGPSNALNASFIFKDQTVHLTATVQGKGTVVVKKAVTGELVQKLDLTNSNRLDSPLQNQQDNAVWLRVELSGGADALNIVIPGRVKTAKLYGEGSLADCAIALADTYRMPVLLKGKIAESKVIWKLTNADTPDSVSSSLSRTGISATVLQSGLIEISSP